MHIERRPNEQLFCFHFTSFAIAQGSQNNEQNEETLCSDWLPAKEQRKEVFNGTLVTFY